MAHRPLVIGYHIVFTAYGWWLPNDPRGSWSKTIRQDILKDLGELHFGRKPVQPVGREICEFYREAAKRLKHELLTFDRARRESIASAFADVMHRERYTCWACAIMPDHVHLVMRKHKHKAEEMIAMLQGESRLRLRADHVGDTSHPIWGGCGYKVFLDHPDDVWRTIPYVNENPIKVRLPRQSWAFVQPYDNWPLHDGHSPRSPYVRALKAAGLCQ